MDNHSSNLQQHTISLDVCHVCQGRPSAHLPPSARHLLVAYEHTHYFRGGGKAVLQVEVTGHVQFCFLLSY
jgi:hypothetical protein